MAVNQREDQLLKYTTLNASAENQLTLFISTMVNDLRNKGEFLTEASGVYDRALAVVYEDSFISSARFSGDEELLDG